uniref:NADH dehydrogenase [ubiquinone] 1 alpha subcomplex subunit 11 n=1 Tax=Amphimedon queenslandica TaxID=400682 RepID=A0A1X7U4G9_AMPQE
MSPDPPFYQPTRGLYDVYCLKMASDPELVESHIPSGENCLDKSVNLGTKGLMWGAFYGAVEACVSVESRLITKSGPLLMYTLRTIRSRGLIGGSVLFTYAGVCCLSSRLRTKDDYFNAFVGGAMAASIVGIYARSIPLTLGLSFASGVTMAIIKYRHGTYLPPIPLRGATIRQQERAWPTNESR